MDEVRKIACMLRSIQGLDREWQGKEKRFETIIESGNLGRSDLLLPGDGGGTKVVHED